MKSYKDKGIIIKIKQFKESDKLVIILGEEYGRIEAVAKGAGKLLSKKTGSIDLLNLASFSFHKTKGIDLLLEAELLDDYSDIKSSLGSISEIFYLLEIIDKFMLGEGGDNEFYQDLTWFLQMFRSGVLERDILFSGLEL
ncbi:DNA repair protein RecO, partial [Candidatus Dojkabacteria bacterium]|nr:DNA repair protein RecO [Candidatus Dojkabacteria bacterium]